MILKNGTSSFAISDDFSENAHANLRPHTGMYMWCFSSSLVLVVSVNWRVKAQRSPVVQSAFGFGAVLLTMLIGRSTQVRPTAIFLLVFELILIIALSKMFICKCQLFTISYNGPCVTTLFLFCFMFPFLLRINICVSVAALFRKAILDSTGFDHHKIFQRLLPVTRRQGHEVLVSSRIQTSPHPIGLKSMWRWGL